MKERAPKKYDPYGGGCPMLVIEILAPKTAERIRAKAEKRWGNYVELRVKGLERYYYHSASMQKGLTEILEGVSIGEHEKTFQWGSFSDDPVISISFRDPAPMRNILHSPELRPDELSITSYRQDDGGLPGSISFVAGELDGNKVEMTYDNYIWGHGGYVLGSSDDFSDYGYKKNEHLRIKPLGGLWQQQK